MQHILTQVNFLQKPISELLTLIKDINEKLKIRARNRDAYNQLSALSNRELNDIGLSRGDIYSVAFEKTSDYHTKINGNMRGYV